MKFIEIFVKVSAMGEKKFSNFVENISAYLQRRKFPVVRSVFALSNLHAPCCLTAFLCFCSVLMLFACIEFAAINYDSTFSIGDKEIFSASRSWFLRSDPTANLFMELCLTSKILR
jgi:hypothetical protein